METTPVIEDAFAAGAKSLFARLFVPVDFTMVSHLAVGVALALQRAFGSRVCLFQFAERGGADEFLGGLGDPATPADLAEGAEDRLRRFVANIAPGYEDAVEVRACGVAKPVEDLRYEARKWGATMVVAASRVEGFFRSPAEKLVHGFEVPVLVIPSHETEASSVHPAIKGAAARSASTPSLQRR